MTGLATPLSLDDLKPEIININVSTPYGKVLTLPMRVMSWFEYNACVAHLVEPSIPLNRRNPMTGKNDLPNPDDTKYKEDRRAFNERRQYVRTLKAFMDAGNFPELAGLDEDEQIDRFTKGAAADIALRLSDALDKAVGGGQVIVETLADTFQSNVPPNGHASTSTVGDTDGG